MACEMLHIDRKHAQEMVAHALEEDPNECCGILAGKDGQVLQVYRMTNVATSPYRYDMDPVQQLHVYRELDDKGWETIAVYHSHTHSQAYPSPTDVRLATWPEERYILISLLNRDDPPIRAFHIDGEKIIEEELSIGEAQG